MYMYVTELYTAYRATVRAIHSVKVVAVEMKMAASGWNQPMEETLKMIVCLPVHR